MKFPKLKISSKALLFFLIVSLLPLVIVSYVQVSSAHNQLTRAASAKQQTVAASLSEKVDNFLGNKISQLQLLAQISSDTTNQPVINRDVAALLKQDTAINNVYVLSSNGMIQLAYDRQGQAKNIEDEDQSGTDAYKAAYFLLGKPYVSTVSYDDNNAPYITIAVPFGNNVENAKKLTDSIERFGEPDDIKGVIVANYKIDDLWQSVLSTKIGDGGYAYVVDELGNLVAHPDRQYFAAHPKLENVQAVNNYRNGQLDTAPTRSENGIDVISTPRPLSRVGWAVIVEEPVASIYADVNSYIRLSTTIGVVVIAFAVLIAIYFSRQLTEPIKKLSLSAHKLGSGELEQVVDIKTNDELEDLADTFNSMSRNIHHLVSDMRSKNQSLTTERTKLSRIIDSVNDGIVALNTHGEIVSINPPAAKLVGSKPADLLGKKLVDLFYWEQEGKPFQLDISTTGLEKYTDLTLPAGKNVSYIDLMVYVLEQRDSDIATIITIHDLTQSRELNFMKLDFVAIAAHELRTPLTVVRGYLDMLSTDAVKQMSIINIESLQKAIVGTDQLRNLINKLLNIARIERGEMEIFVEKMNLVNMVIENVHQHQTPAAQRLQTLNCSIETDHPVYVPADPSSILEVLNNLIGNAIKYTPEKGEILVRLYVDGDEVRVEVSDNGPGIPEDLRKRLFTKFYRAERSLIAGTRGTGLGLFISKTIIELQGGKIGLEPDQGKGSTFYFTLPVYNAEKHDALIAKDKQLGGVRGWFKKRPHS